jgi:hypothetical protein
MAGEVPKAVLRDVLRDAGFSFRSGSWYRPTPDVIQIVNLQKSRFGPDHFINIGWWLNGVAAGRRPGEMWNLTVDTDHTFFVGEGAWLKRGQIFAG